jgi:hypothetical protein
MKTTSSTSLKSQNENAGNIYSSRCVVLILLAGLMLVPPATLRVGVWDQGKKTSHFALLADLKGGAPTWRIY